MKLEYTLQIIISVHSYLENTYMYVALSLEKEMAAHSSILALRIPWTGEPGRLCDPWDRRESDMTEVTEQVLL